MESKNLKFLIGTLHSGENEYHSCLKSIENQDYTLFKHIVISGLPNREAHNLLYKRFMDSSEIFDFFIKIDADMIIEDPQFLKKLNTFLIMNEDISRLIIPVFDFYTDKEILGVNVYKNDVKWDIESNEKYFVDRIHIDSTIKNTLVEQFEFKNAISHCRHPNKNQTYMYGYHRTLKAFQPDKLYSKSATSNWLDFCYIYRHKLKNEIYINVFSGVENAIFINYRNINNSYSQQVENIKTTKKLSWVLNFFFKSINPYVSYSLVYVFVKLNFLKNWLLPNGNKDISRVN